MSLSLGDSYENFSKESQDNSTPLEDTYHIFEVQPDNFLREPRVFRTTNIYAYWYCSKYPALELAAKKFLSAPATSVASEQLFSAADQLYSNHRSNLLRESAEKLFSWHTMFDYLTLTACVVFIFTVVLYGPACNPV